MKIHPEVGGLFHADGQTDMTNVIVAFHSFAKAPKYDPQEVICEDVDWIELARSNEFHCFTVHFNSLCVMVQLMHLFVIKH
jgi:hypothetical protein